MKPPQFIPTAADREKLAAMHKPMSYDELLAEFGTSMAKTLVRYRKRGWVYVCRHRFNAATGKYLSMYRAGNRPDAEPPSEPPARAVQMKQKEVKPKPVKPPKPKVVKPPKPKPPKPKVVKVPKPKPVKPKVVKPAVVKQPKPKAPKPAKLPPSVARYFKENPNASTKVIGGVIYRRNEI